MWRLHFQIVFSRKLRGQFLEGRKKKGDTVPQDDYDEGANGNPSMLFYAPFIIILKPMLGVLTHAKLLCALCPGRALHMQQNEEKDQTGFSKVEILIDGVGNAGWTETDRGRSRRGWKEESKKVFVPKRRRTEGGHPWMKTLRRLRMNGERERERERERENRKPGFKK